MTRETKIGLIVGLGVIIFIGILISDYLSVAQRQQSADLNQLAFGEGQADNPENPYNMVPLTQRDGGQADAAERRRRGQRDQRFQADELVIDTRDLDPQRESDSDSTESDHTSGGQSDPRGYTPYQPDPQPQRETVRIGQEDESTESEPTRRAAVHHVGSGETLSKIAAQHYGDPGLWRVIHEANRDKVPDPARLRQGVALTIPPVDRADRADDGDQTDRDTDTDPVPEPTETRTYTIRRGDSLSKIAERVYGSQREMDKLLELNRDLIDDPDRIVVGMEIRVPAN